MTELRDILLLAATTIDIWRPVAVLLLATIVLACLTFAIDALEPDHRRDG